LVQRCSIKTNIQRRQKYLVLGRDKSYFVNIGLKKLSEADISQLLDGLIDNIFAMHGGRVFQFNRHSTFLSISTVLPLCQLVPLPVLGRFHTAVPQEKRKETSSIL
jgi:hypothetical protein